MPLNFKKTCNLHKLQNLPEKLSRDIVCPYVKDLRMGLNPFPIEAFTIEDKAAFPYTEAPQ